MVSKADPNKVWKYLIDNNYLDVYIFLISSLDNLRNRASLLNKNIKELEEKIKRMIEQVNLSSEKIVPENTEVSSMFKDIHYAELEVIQRINILIELMAVYYYMIRSNLKELPRCIGRNDFPTKKLRQEFEYFNNQKLTDVYVNFNYPNANSFDELSDEEKKILKELLNQSATKILSAFKEIYRFQKNFRTVYNKYKHTLSEFTGVFGIDYARKEIQTHIYVRHKENDEFCTYIIPVSLDEVKYFTEISARVYLVLRALIDGVLLRIVNEGRDFIPRTLFIEKAYETKFKEIADKLQTCVMPEFISKMIVKPPDQKTIEQINRQLREQHIYKMKDILDIGNLLKEGVTISKD
ncbi:MAG: hypothetical protein QXH91_02375 [Candidatus Bathyarchaeia archaeon]